MKANSSSRHGGIIGVKASGRAFLPSSIYPRRQLWPVRHTSHTSNTFANKHHQTEMVGGAQGLKFFLSTVYRIAAGLLLPAAAPVLFSRRSLLVPFFSKD